ncbi:MAG: radical SAM protein [Desulfovibrio sp.]
MAKKTKPRPRLVVSNKDGEIFDHPDLLMMCDRGGELSLPRPDEYVPLPRESEFFLLPGRNAIGYNEATGEVEELEEFAMAAFVCPGYTITGTAAYSTAEDAPVLPLLAYAAIGYENNRFWVCAKQVDEDKRQVFNHIPCEKVEEGAYGLQRKLPENRLVKHLTNCALTSGCPAAKNLALGRFECPLPTAQVCNARCVGCISEQPEDSPFPSPQCRIDFTPTADEIVEIMHHHAGNERKPIFSFGQGCEGEPLTEAKLLCDAAKKYRAESGKGTINVNTNGSLTDTIPDLAAAGFNSIRVSMNSLREGPYTAYYRPKGYSFEDVLETVRVAKKHNLHVALNYLFFPGVNDTENELAALMDFVEETKLDLLQLRNLNLDPELYVDLVSEFDHGAVMGFNNFRKRLKKQCPWVKFGYFNPYLGS